MRFALLILAFMVAAQAPAPCQKEYQASYCPRTANLEAAPQQEYWFEGLLGKKHVRVYLNRGGKGVVGVFYDTSDWIPVFLGGDWMQRGMGSIEVTAHTPQDKPMGVLKGDFTEGGLTGVWERGGDKEEIDFHWKAVPQPKCDGKEPWKNFHNAHWPVTFSYPGSWHVSETENSVTLTCPDASLMAYDEQEINIWQGAEANESTSDMIQCGEKWIYGLICKCGRDQDGCKTAEAMEREGMTILKADQLEWRVSCRNGGYVGLGWGDRRVMTFEDTWIVVEAEGQPAELVERIVGSAKRRK
jgi:hypothetical protein